MSLDIGSNSVGSMWFDDATGHLTTGTSIFPAGVDESDDKRGDPKNAKRRMTRRTRITLARRANRKRELRLRLIHEGLLPADAAGFKTLLETTDPWALRRRGLDNALTPHEFGRVLLHLAQRRGALGLKIAEIDENDPEGESEDGAVKAAIGEVRAKMLQRKARTFGEFIAMTRDERVTPLTSPDNRKNKKGPREYRDAIRNKAGSYEHCADRAMIRDEFAKLWDAQKKNGGETAKRLTDALRLALDDESGDSTWRHKGLLFGQRRQSWDLGTLGRCVLEPSERCAPHADMYASRYRVVETVNILKIIERGKEARSLTADERSRILAYLSGPLGMEKGRKKKGSTEEPQERPKTTVSVTDLRNFMGTTKEGWGRGTKTSLYRFNIENDEDRTINTDWFAREIVHGAIGVEQWGTMNESLREGINRAILRHDPEQDGEAEKLKAGVMKWGGLDEAQADVLIAAWKRRPKLDAKRLNMSRKAVRNLLVLMDRPEPWDDANRAGQKRWLTAIEARRLIAEDGDFCDATTGQPIDEHTRRRYATGAKGATARDRYYMNKHVLMKNGKPIIGPDGKPLAEPPPAPMISNPVVRKAIHEVRRHLVEYMMHFGRKPDEVYIELAREARMGKKDADAALFRNRLRNRIRNEIIRDLGLESRTPTQQRAAVDRVVLCMQQGGVCPLCGKGGLTARCAANGEGCEVAHIIPRASGGHNGLGNLVLGHIKCNREMGRRTPRQYWEASLSGGFEAGVGILDLIYGDVKRPKPSEFKSATGDPLWACYFRQYDDKTKIEQFKKDIKDIQEMTNRQDAATKYAARQVMAYLADALYDGKGLPERSSGGDASDTKRRIFATDGMWTSRLRREWGLFFDPHDAKAKGLESGQEHERKEKNRGDHRHHAVDAVVIGLCTRQIQIQWEEREKRADAAGINTADEEAMENYRRHNPLPIPAPFESREALRDAVRRAVFGEGEIGKPICHRPVKRKLIGALHQETLLGPVLDANGQLTEYFVAKKSILALDPNHLRMPRPETANEAIERLAVRRARDKSIDDKTARKWARGVVAAPGFRPGIVDPPPGNPGIVRDQALRRRLRACLEEVSVNPDDFTANQVKKIAENGGFRQVSGVPIRSFVLLRTMSEPVIIARQRQDYATGHFGPDPNPASLRAYLGGNNHHIEIRENDKGKLTGEIVSAFEAAQRKLAKLRAFRAAGIPKPEAFKKLSKTERAMLTPTLRQIERDHPIVDRRDDDAKGGRFVMSLCEGETVFMQHKQTNQLGYFVLAKIFGGNRMVLVPHWDARAATARKDAEGNKVTDSEREDFSIAPGDLSKLAPPDKTHAVKVRVGPLGDVAELDRD